MIYYWTLGEKINQKKNNLLRLGLDHNYNFVKKNIFNTPSYNSICGNSGNSRKKEGITDDGVNDISAGCRAEITQLAAYSEEIVLRRKLKEVPFSEINKSFFSWIIKPYKKISNKLRLNINKNPYYVC